MGCEEMRQARATTPGVDDRGRPRRARARRGTASFLAMTYLVLFSSLALGFHAATTMSVQVAANDRRSAAAQSAAESGLAFMKYQLKPVSVPPNTPRDGLVTEVYNDLKAQLAGSGTLAGASVGGGAQFRSDLTLLSDGSFLMVTRGRQGAATQVERTIQLRINVRQQRATSFDHAVASRGGIQLLKGSITASPDPAAAKLAS